MRAKRGGGDSACGNLSNPKRGHQSCDRLNLSIHPVPQMEKVAFARSSSRRLLPLVLLLFVGSCSLLPLNSDRDAAPSDRVDHVWNAPRSVGEAGDEAPTLVQLRASDSGLATPAPNGGEYDLPALIDFALRTNPQTRRAWDAAQAADAQLGETRAANYPQIGASGEGGYLKLPVQFPGQTLVVRNEAFLPQIRVSYDLLDFGRTNARARGALEQLIAANFAFDRAIQDVVFGVEKSYYVLAAAKASVAAAESNLKLAGTSIDAVRERHQVGLSTKPQILLAKQVEAQAVYDLENARSMVRDALAALYQAIGVAPDASIAVHDAGPRSVPLNLGDDVEKLMADSLAKRPDIAAQLAAVRAGDAAIAGAKSEFLPSVGVDGDYGQIIWSYTVNGGHTQNLNQPFYGALLTLRWDLFTGFDRYYGVRKATAERDAARSELKSLELDVAAAVWRAYYDFISAQKKYDAAQALVAASEESYSATLESHRHGLATITDLIAAERDLMAARYTLVQGKADLLVSSAAVVHAVGAELASKPPSS
jgi:outer membrane protein